ncbi:membrane protein insertase YidC [Oxalobacter vibrioformis]|uniref:Membrane protein insertase YidC n=1 Tax=Oxalobacter vibrioformis TaxID=933080 RepID=A0A9E9LZB9_9BURK|nr:membrane protein insertase YidC [Oxalobacter vibrioformis]WAW11261.1 membrane protein insertase YidC [Oxalobacter vibrioformis]
MDTKKRTTLWLILAIALFMLWDNWQVYQGGTSLFFRGGAKEAQTAKDKAGLPEVPIQTAAIPAAEEPEQNTAETKRVAPAKPAETITISTDVLVAKISTLGGVIEELELLPHRDNVDAEKHMKLFQKNEHLTYLAQTGLSGGAYPNHTTVYSVRPGSRTLGDANEIQLIMDAEQGGVRLTKTYTFHRNDYTIDIKHDVTNLGKDPIHPSVYLQLVRDDSKPEGQSRWISTFTGPAVYSAEDKFQKLDFDKIADGKAEFATKVDNGWIGMVQHYFVSAIIPKEEAARENFARKIDDHLFAFGSLVPVGTVEPHKTVTSESRLYAGPQESAVLEKTAPGLELVKDYGWLTIIAKPIFWLMVQIHKEVGNWGWTIILLTVLIKVAFVPLSAASYRSMARMKQHMPKIMELKDRYKDDKPRQNQVLMDYYKTEKINPVGGCLPVVIQIPVFISLYWVLLASIEIRNAPWLGWITDLAAPDPFYILPVLMAVSMFIQQKMSPPPPDPMQAKLMMTMPIIFSITFFFFPSGLVLYWVVNNILSILQQWWVTKRYMAGKIKEKPKAKGKS